LPAWMVNCAQIPIIWFSPLSLVGFLSSIALVISRLRRDGRAKVRRAASA